MEAAAGHRRLHHVRANNHDSPEYQKAEEYLRGGLKYESRKEAANPRTTKLNKSHRRTAEFSGNHSSADAAKAAGGYDSEGPASARVPNVLVCECLFMLCLFGWLDSCSRTLPGKNGGYLQGLLLKTPFQPITSQQESNTVAPHDILFFPQYLLNFQWPSPT